MKLIIFSSSLLLLLNFTLQAQYEDTDKRGIYFSKKNYTDFPLPVFESSIDKLPSPVLEESPEYVKLYWKAWELAFKHFKKPPIGSPFVSNYLDEAFSPNIFQWDTIFMIMFARYAHYIFPAIQSLDNFYCRQYENGYICREIVEATGEDFVYEGRQNTINPPIFSWAEVESYKITGDKSRFKMVLPVMEKYVEWLEQYRKKPNTAHHLYWQTGLGSGMDNTPRSGSGWVDMSSQMVMQYRDMAFICNELGLKDKEDKYNKRADEISALINKFMWNEEDGLYFDVDDIGNQVKWKTVACFWPMLAGAANKHQAEKLLDNLNDPHSFWRPIPFPSLAADQKGFKADGEYWVGAVWASTNVAIIKGLDRIAEDSSYKDPDFLKSQKVFNEFAALAVERYLDGLCKVYKKTGTIWENYSSESFSRGNPSQPDFVGWSGCGPIELLIENVLGFRPNGADNSLTWYIKRIDNHGIKKLRFGNVTASLICEKREAVNKPCKINISSDKNFTLKVFDWNYKMHEFKINKGSSSIVVN